jgi:hypothetical protein
MLNLLLPSILLLVSATPLSVAQSPSGTQGSCSYDQCALRLEGSDLFRGVQSTKPVGRLRLWGGPRLAELVGTADSARIHALRFDANYATGMRLSFVGGLLLAPVILDAVRGGSGMMRREHQIYLSVPGAAFVFIGGVKMRTANVALSRAIWWYNRDLPR